MPKSFLTDKHKAFIKANRLKMSGTQMAEKFGCGKAVVNRYMRENGLQVPREVSNRFRGEAHKGKTTMTAAQDAFIKENYLKMPVKTLAAAIGKSGCGVSGRLRQLGLTIPKEIIEQRKSDSHFQKGQPSFNQGKRQKDYMRPEMIEKTKATRFKKGSIPHNTKYNGHQRITKDGYIEIRVKRGVYRLKHLWEWEGINGALPEGHCLRCVDGNIQNTAPENWKLITRAENMILNTIHRYPEEVKTSIRLVNKLNKVINQKMEI